MRTRHTWEQEDDIGLLVAIDDTAALREHYPRQGYASDAPWWDAVAGRLHTLREGAITVTGAACRARYARLEETFEKAPRHNDWDVARARVEHMEVETRQWLLEQLRDLERLAADLGSQAALFIGAAHGRLLVEAARLDDDG